MESKPWVINLEKKGQIEIEKLAEGEESLFRMGCNDPYVGLSHDGKAVIPNQTIIPHPDFNFELEMFDDVIWTFHCHKTLSNRIKYWLFCQFFPSRIKRWDKEIG